MDAQLRKSYRLKNFEVDHCHLTGKIRGLLCDRCNRGLGYFKDNSKALLNASKYILRIRQPAPQGS